jgi:hypothetical protein
MFTHTLRVATIVAVALSAAPAFALCNPGTKNCVTAGGSYSFLSKAKQQVFVQPTSGQCDPGPAGICNDNLPSPSLTTPTTGLHPITTTTPIVVK